MAKSEDFEKINFSELLLNEVNLIVVSSDEKGNINYVSRATEKIIGYDIGSLLGKQWWKKTSISIEEGLKFKEKICNILSGEIEVDPKPYERKLKCKDGSYKWIEWRDSLSENNIFVSVGVDISDWKKTEEIKMQSDTIINNVDSMIFVSDKEGKILFASPSVEKMLGYTESEILGDNWWRITYESEHQASKVKNAIYNYVFYQTKDFTDISKRRIKTKSGDYKWIEWQLSKGVNETYISIGTDITNRISSEIELKEAKETAEKSLKVKDEFLSNMSHEIRTPLNALIGFTDLLLESDLNQEQQEHLETMRNSGEILLSLINNVLDLAKLDSNKLEVENISFDLYKCLHDIVKLMRLRANEKSISLDLKIDPNTPKQVFGDSTRLGQILLNLIGNAIKFTNEGSVVLLVKKVGETEEGSNIYFEISDTGIGIVPNKINTVFGVFTQAKSDTSRIYGGTGLGLAIVKKLVTLFKGEIKVQSKFGEGSVFKMNLMFDKDETKTISTKTNVIEKKDEHLGLKILLVEDNKTNQLLARIRLERWGCEVEIANNGIEGVKAAQQKSYDIILMDIQMPVMDGYEAAKIIKNDLSKQIAKIPIIAMTAYTAKEDIEKAFEAGMNDYIFKPFDAKDLYLLLNKYGNLKDEIDNKEIDAEEPIKIEVQQRYTDLKFLKQETLNESSILKMLIELFIKDIGEFLVVLDNGLKNKDWDLLHKATHKIKPSVSMFGISKLEPTIHSLMNKFAKEKQLEDVDDLVGSCKEILSIVKDELLIELKNLGNE